MPGDVCKITCKMDKDMSMHDILQAKDRGNIGFEHIEKRMLNLTIVCAAGTSH